MTPESLLIVLMSSHMLIRCCCYKKVQVRKVVDCSVTHSIKEYPGIIKISWIHSTFHTHSALLLWEFIPTTATTAMLPPLTTTTTEAIIIRLRRVKSFRVSHLPPVYSLKTMRKYIYKIKHTARDETSKNVGQRSFYDGIYMTNNDVNKWNAKQCLNYASQPIDSVNLWTIKHDIFPGILSYLIV